MAGGHDGSRRPRGVSSVDQIDAEHILIHWGEVEVSEEDRLAAARYGLAEIDDALTRLEAKVPEIAEEICSREAQLRDFPDLGGAYRCGERS
jgi:hypothetical protein